jgi:hypothetical protein
VVRGSERESTGSEETLGGRRIGGIAGDKEVLVGEVIAVAMAIYRSFVPSSAYVRRDRRHRDCRVVSLNPKRFCAPSDVLMT